MRDIALALFIFGMIPYTLMRPYVGLLVWSWLGYMNPNRLCYGFAISFPWVELVAIVTLLSLLFSKESKKIPWSTTSVLLVMFLLWTGLTTFFAVVPNSAWEKWLEFAKILVMVFVTLVLINNRERMHWLVWMIVVSLGFYGVKGGLFTILHGGGNHVFGPPASFIADNNALALALCMTLPFMRYLQLHSSRKLVRTGLGFGMLLTGIAVLGTYSRGGLIALVIVAGALFLKSRGRLAVVLVIVAVGFTAYHFMPAQWTDRMDTLHHAGQTDSGETRIQSYEFAASVAAHRPLLGGGFNVYQSASLWRSYGPEDAIPRAIHSIYFRVMGEQGFPGLVLFLMLLFVSWRNCSRVRKRTRDIPDMKWAFDLASMLQVSLVAFMAAGAFLPMSYFDLAYQVMALCAILELHMRQRASQPARELHYGSSPGAFAVSGNAQSVAGVTT
ncbi:MAG: putative O-glycosylation ligase, exosortase A system-associated [Rhodanobacter sp.]|nr:MAG: putative O-glycosylation ligase, exosortase A system-associated [Rhodanobacter sp.]TAL94003.1 MAG: putative O-glycosylation ligase, exosortase A system-associated [Rhodanobacter sp.]TAM40888.1 MAG: putative O-glycosylation ligase, exosortase A system-associated [Rhodanobacter sp.]TAN25712.1 MAG: putative O-glycosylation ligase, exosortase A system-associated [Rhodanobacter sp.]